MNSFVQACVKEALRVFGPVPMGLPRIAPKGGLTIGHRTIPEGTIISINCEYRDLEHPICWLSWFFILNLSMGYTLFKGDMGCRCACLQTRAVVGRRQWYKGKVLDAC